MENPTLHDQLALVNSLLAFTNELPQDSETHTALVEHLQNDGFAYPEKSLSLLQEAVNEAMTG